MTHKRLENVFVRKLSFFQFSCFRFYHILVSNTQKELYARVKVFHS